jgi:hypothetical protein
LSQSCEDKNCFPLAQSFPLEITLLRSLRELAFGTAVAKQLFKEDQAMKRLLRKLMGLSVLVLLAGGAAGCETYDSDYRDYGRYRYGGYDRSDRYGRYDGWYDRYGRYHRYDRSARYEGWYDRYGRYHRYDPYARYEGWYDRDRWERERELARRDRDRYDRYAWYDRSGWWDRNSERRNREPAGD